MRTFTYHTNFRGVNQNEYVISSRPIETRGPDGHIIISSYPDRDDETECGAAGHGACANVSATCETQHVECDDSIRELVFPKRVPQGSDTDVTITEHFSR